MLDEEFQLGVEEYLDEPEMDISVSVKCPYCPRGFEGPRDSVEEELFMHLWKVHEESSLEYMLNNMYIPPWLKERIFGEMGPEYVSWVVDKDGEVLNEL
jgi:hypothetical protein